MESLAAQIRGVLPNATTEQIQKVATISLKWMAEWATKTSQEIETTPQERDWEGYPFEELLKLKVTDIVPRRDYVINTYGAAFGNAALSPEHLRNLYMGIDKFFFNDVLYKYLASLGKSLSFAIVKDTESCIKNTPSECTIFFPLGVFLFGSRFPSEYRHKTIMILESLLIQVLLRLSVPRTVPIKEIETLYKQLCQNLFGHDGIDMVKYIDETQAATGGYLDPSLFPSSSVKGVSNGTSEVISMIRPAKWIPKSVNSLRLEESVRVIYQGKVYPGEVASRNVSFALVKLKSGDMLQVPYTDIYFPHEFEFPTS